MADSKPNPSSYKGALSLISEVVRVMNHGTRRCGSCFIFLFYLWPILQTRAPERILPVSTSVLSRLEGQRVGSEGRPSFSISLVSLLPRRPRARGRIPCRMRLSVSRICLRRRNLRQSQSPSDEEKQCQNPRFCGVSSDLVELTCFFSLFFPFSARLRFSFSSPSFLVEVRPVAFLDLVLPRLPP